MSKLGRVTQLNHFTGVGRAVPGDVLADSDQIIDGLFFPMDDVHALPLRQLDCCPYLAHRFVMRDGRAGVVERLLYLGLEPFRVGRGGVRILHRSGAVRTLGGGGAVRVVVHRIYFEARDADPFQLIDQRFELAEDASLAAALRHQRMVGHPICDDDAPAAVLADHVRAAHHASL